MTPRPLTLALASTGLLLQPLLASSQDLLPVVSPRFQTPILLAAQSIEARPEAPTAGSEAAAAYDPVGAAFKGLRLNASDWTRAEADALTITNALRSARDQRDGVKAQYGAAVDQAQFISRMGEAALILTGYTAVTPAAAAAATAALTPLGVALAAGSAMALKAGGDYMLEAQRAEFDTAVARAQQEYRGKIDEMAAWVAGRATHSAAAGESTVQAAARYAAELTNTQEFRSLDPEARAEVKRQLSERMLERLARGDVPSSQQTDALATKTAASAQGVAAIQKDVSTLERRLGANVVALEASTAATQAGLQALEDRMVTKVGQVQGKHPANTP